MQWVDYPNLSCMVLAMTNRTDHSEEEIFLTPGEAAKNAFVTTKTLSRLADSGALRAIKLPSGHRRYSATDIQRLKDGTLTITRTYKPLGGAA